jgi:outer membrane protein TolC
MKYILIHIIAILVFAQQSYAQKEEISLNLTLEQAIDIANKQSIYSFRQKNMYLSKYWEFRSFKAETQPKLSFNSTLANYRHAIISRYDRTLNEDVFLPVEQINSEASLNMSKKILLTGGEITISSQLERLNNIESKSLSYYSSPLSIGFTQPLNGYNRFKWQARIEPLKFEQAKREYLQNLQELAIKTTNAFFGFIKAEINLNIAETNLSNADTLFRIGKGRFEIGTVTQDELLDLELSYLNANMALSKAKINLQQAQMRLNSFLGFEDNIAIMCLLPHKIPSIKIEVNEALQKAYANNPQILSFEQQLTEARRNVAKAKGENGINLNLKANAGYNKNANDVYGTYQKPLEETQNIRLALGIPIVDGGLRKGRVQIARSNQKVTEATVKQARINFEQDIFIQVMEFNMQEEQVKIAAKADTIAKLGYEVTKQRFLIDKVDVIKLNSARNSLDAAKRNYIESIQNYWISYFNMQKLTLYDFEKNISLIEETDHLLQN